MRLEKGSTGESNERGITAPQKIVCFEISKNASRWLKVKLLSE